MSGTIQAFQDTSVTVTGTSWTELVALAVMPADTPATEGRICPQHSQMCFEVENNSAASGDDLSDFEVQIKVHPSSTEWRVWMTGANLDGSPSRVGGLTWRNAIASVIKTLAKDGSAARAIWLPPCYAVRLAAKPATGKTVTLAVRGIISEWPI